MSSDKSIKKYVIEIETKVKKAQENLGELQESISSISDADLSASLKKQTEELALEFKKCTSGIKTDVKSIKSVLNRLNPEKLDELSNQLSIITEKTKTLQELLKSNNAIGFEETIAALTKPFKELTSAIKSVDTSISNLNKNFSKINFTQTIVKQAKESVDAYEAMADDLEEIFSNVKISSNIDLLDKKSREKNEKEIKKFLSSAMMAYNKAIRKYGNNFDINNYFSDYTIEDIKKYYAEYFKENQKAVEKANESISKSDHTFKLDAELDDKQNIDKIVNEVEDKVINKVSEELEKRNIGIKIPVNPDFNGMREGVRNEVKKYNKELRNMPNAPKFKVGITGELDYDKLDAKTEELKKKSQISVNSSIVGGEFKLSSDTELNKTTSEIRDILKDWNSAGVPSTTIESKKKYDTEKILDKYRDEAIRSNIGLKTKRYVVSSQIQGEAETEKMLLDTISALNGDIEQIKYAKKVKSIDDLKKTFLYSRTVKDEKTGKEYATYSRAFNSNHEFMPVEEFRKLIEDMFVNNSAGFTEALKWAQDKVKHIATDLTKYNGLTFDKTKGTYHLKKSGNAIYGTENLKELVNANASNYLEEKNEELADEKRYYDVVKERRDLAREILELSKSTNEDDIEVLEQKKTRFRELGKKFIGNTADEEISSAKKYQSYEKRFLELQRKALTTTGLNETEFQEYSSLPSKMEALFEPVKDVIAEAIKLTTIIPGSEISQIDLELKNSKERQSAIFKEIKRASVEYLKGGHLLNPETLEPLDRERALAYLDSESQYKEDIRKRDELRKRFSFLSKYQVENAGRYSYQDKKGNIKTPGSLYGLPEVLSDLNSTYTRELTALNKRIALYEAVNPLSEEELKLKEEEIKAQGEKTPRIKGFNYSDDLTSVFYKYFLNAKPNTSSINSIMTTIPEAEREIVANMFENLVAEIDKTHPVGDNDLINKLFEEAGNQAVTDLTKFITDKIQANKNEIKKLKPEQNKEKTEYEKENKELEAALEYFKNPQTFIEAHDIGDLKNKLQSLDNALDNFYNQRESHISSLENDLKNLTNSNKKKQLQILAKYTTNEDDDIISFEEAQKRISSQIDKLSKIASYEKLFTSNIEDLFNLSTRLPQLKDYLSNIGFSDETDFSALTDRQRNKISKMGFEEYINPDKFKTFLDIANFFEDFSKNLQFDFPDLFEILSNIREVKSQIKEAGVDSSLLKTRTVNGKTVPWVDSIVRESGANQLKDVITSENNIRSLLPFIQAYIEDQKKKAEEVAKQVVEESKITESSQKTSSIIEETQKTDVEILEEKRQQARLINKSIEKHQSGLNTLRASLPEDVSFSTSERRTSNLVDYSRRIKELELTIKNEMSSLKSITSEIDELSNNRMSSLSEEIEKTDKEILEEKKKQAEQIKQNVEKNQSELDALKGMSANDVLFATTEKRGSNIDYFDVSATALWDHSKRIEELEAIIKNDVSILKSINSEIDELSIIPQKAYERTFIDIEAINKFNELISKNKKSPLSLAEIREQASKDVNERTRDLIARKRVAFSDKDIKSFEKTNSDIKARNDASQANAKAEQDRRNQIVENTEVQKRLIEKVGELVHEESTVAKEFVNYSIETKQFLKGAKYAGMTPEQAEVTHSLSVLNASTNNGKKATKRQKAEIERLKKEAEALELKVSKAGYAYLPGITKEMWASNPEALNKNKYTEMALSGIDPLSGVLAQESTLQKILKNVEKISSGNWSAGNNKPFKNSNKPKGERISAAYYKDLNSENPEAQNKALSEAIKSGLNIFKTQSGKYFIGKQDKIGNNENVTKQLIDSLKINTSEIKKNTKSNESKAKDSKKDKKEKVTVSEALLNDKTYSLDNVAKFNGSNSRQVTRDLNYVLSHRNLSVEELSKASEMALSSGLILDASTDEKGNTKFFAKKNPEFKKEGERIAQDIADGITKNSDAATEAIKKTDEEIIEASKDTLGIHSPSVPFKEQAKQIIAGLEEGTLKNKEEFLMMMRGFGKEVITAFVQESQKAINKYKQTASTKIKPETKDKYNTKANKLQYYNDIASGMVLPSDYDSKESNFKARKELIKARIKSYFEELESTKEITDEFMAEYNSLLKLVKNSHDSTNLQEANAKLGLLKINGSNLKDITDISLRDEIIAENLKHDKEYQDADIIAQKLKAEDLKRAQAEQKEKVQHEKENKSVVTQDLIDLEKANKLLARYYELLSKKKALEQDGKYLSNNDEHELEKLQYTMDFAKQTAKKYTETGFDTAGLNLEDLAKISLAAKMFMEADASTNATSIIRQLDIQERRTHGYSLDKNNQYLNSDSEEGKRYRKLLEDVTELQERLKRIFEITDSHEFISSDDIVDAQRLLERIIKINNVLGDYKNNQNLIPVKQKDSSKLKSDVLDYMSHNTAMGREYTYQFQSLLPEINSAKTIADLEKVQDKFEKLKSEVKELGKEGLSTFDKVVKKIGDSNARLFARFFSLYDWIRYGRQIAQIIIEIDTSLTELRKVSDATTERLNQSFEKSAQTAKEFGASISEVISATSEWARLGYNVDDAEELAKVAILYKNVGDGIDVNTATDSLISTMKGFSLEAEDAISIIDKFNEVSNNFAITSGGIGAALQRSSAAFAAANTDLSKSIALITTANTVLQDPDKVGNAFTTLSARIRGSKAELEELGEETDIYVKSTSKLRKQVLATTGVDIMSDEKTYKDIYEIIVEISKVWKDINDIDRASLLEALAGKRQSNVIAALLNNGDLLEEVYDTATNSAGSAMEEQEKYMLSVQYSIEQLQAAFQELATSFIQSDTIKYLIEDFTTLLELLTAVPDKLGLIVSAFATLKMMQSEKGGFDLFGEDGATFHGINIKKFNKELSEKVKNKLSKETVDIDTQEVKDKVDKSLDDVQEVLDQEVSEKINPPEIELIDINTQIEDALSDIDENIFDDIEDEIVEVHELFDSNVESMGETLKETFDDTPEIKVNSDSVADLNENLVDTNELVEDVTKETKTQKRETQKVGVEEAKNNALKETGLVVEEATTAEDKAQTAEGFKQNTQGEIAIANQIVLNTLKSIGNAIATMGLSLLISGVATGIFTLIENSIHKVENAKKALIDFRDEVKKTKEELNDNVKSIFGADGESGGFAKEFAKLAQHVNWQTGETDLDTEDYERYLELSNKLYEMFPDLNARIDANGNAFVELTGDVDGITTSLKGLVEQMKITAAQDVKKGLKDKYNDLKTVLGSSKNDYENAETYFKENKEHERTAVEEHLKEFRAAISTEDDPTLYEENLASYLESKGLQEYTHSFMYNDWDDVLNTLYSDKVQNILENAIDPDKAMRNAIDAKKSEFEKASQDYNKMWIDTLMSNDVYSGAETAFQTGIQGLIKSIDFTNEDLQDFDNADTLINSIINSMNSDDIKENFIELISLPEGSLERIKLGEQIQTYLDGLNLEAPVNISFAYSKEADAQHRLINLINNKTQGHYDSSMLETYFGDFDTARIEAFLKFMSENEYELIEGLNKFKEAEQEAKDNTNELFEAFADEGVAEKVNKATSAINNMYSAYKKLSDPNLSPDDMLSSLQTIAQAAKEAGIEITDAELAEFLSGNTAALPSIMKQVVDANREKVLSNILGTDFRNDANISIDLINTLEEAFDKKLELEIESTKLEKTNSELDKLQNSFKSAQEIAESYNKNGQLTLDQAQELLKLESDYNGVLEIKNGQLQLNVDKYKELVAQQLLEVKAQLNSIAADRIKAIAAGESIEMLSNYSEQLSQNTSFLNENTLALIANSGVTAEQAATAIEPLQKFWEGVINGFNDDFNTFMNGTSSASGSMSDALNKSIAILDAKLDASKITFKDYIAERTRLVDDYYKRGLIKADEYYSQLKSIQEKQLSAYDSVISAVTKTIDKQIKVYDKQKDYLNDQREALEKANKAREDAYNWQQKLYNLERAQQSRNKLVYKDGQMQYVADNSAIRDARKDYEDALYNKQLQSIEDQEKAIDKAVKALNEYKEQWTEISSIYQDMQNAVIASQLLGEGWENSILALDPSKLENFRNEYLSLQNEIAQSAVKVAEEIAKAINNAIGGGSGSYHAPIPEEKQTVYRLGVTGAGIPGPNNTSYEYFETQEAANAYYETIRKRNPEAIMSLDETSESVNRLNNYIINSNNGLIVQFGTLEECQTKLAELKESNPEEAWELVSDSIFNANTGLDMYLQNIHDVREAETARQREKEGQLLAEAGLLEETNDKYHAYEVIVDGIGNKLFATKQEADKFRESLEKTYGLSSEMKEYSGSFDEINTSVQNADTGVNVFYGSVDECTQTLDTLQKSNPGASWVIIKDAVNEANNALDEYLKKVDFAKQKQTEQQIVLNQIRNGQYPAHADGGKLTHSEKNAIRSEYGQTELTVYPNGTWELTDKPTISDLPKGTVIYDEDQTNEILKNKTKGGSAFATGTGSKLTLLSDANPEKFKMLNSLVSSVSTINIATNNMNKVLTEAVKGLSLASVTQHSSAPIINMTNTFECNGVTVDQVRTQIANSFDGLLVKAYQNVMK